MNILLITVRSDFGGGPRHVHQLIENLPKTFRIFLAYPDGDPYGNKWNNNNNIQEILKIPFRKFSLRSLWNLKKFIVKNEIAVIHSHGHGAGFYSRILKLLIPNIRVMHTFHGVTDSYESNIKKFSSIGSDRLFKFFTNDFIFVSEGERDMAHKLGLAIPSKSHVIYNGISQPPKSNTANESEFFDIVTLSRFDYQKNMDLAFEIAREFKESLNIRFIWIGEGVDFERLKVKSNKEGLNIVFTGFTDNPFYYLQRADVYLSTSRFEGLPYALVEAISVGLPVIATNVTGNNEVVSDGYNGFLYHKVDEAVEAILCLHSDSQKHNEMSVNSYSKFNSEFTLDTMIDRLAELYNLGQ
jgi:glycosyltransferase involved in cell wall biosynthesis